MTREQRQDISLLADLISLEDETIEDSPETDTLLADFERGEL